MPEPGHPKQFNPIPDGYEYSYLPHTFGGPWSQPLSCTRCGAIVIGRSVKLHDEFHASLGGPHLQGRDAYKFVLSCIATGDCEDPVKLAREILAEGREVQE